MLQHEVSKEQVLEFAEGLKKKLPFNLEENRNLIKKGLNLYRQGSVYNVKYSDQIIHGKVQDVVPVDASIDLEFSEGDHCSCPSVDFCRHRMALFFSVYASVARVGALLDEWKEEMTPSFMGISSSFKKASALQRTYEEHSLSSWQMFFKQEYESFLDQHSDRDRHFFSLIYYNFFQGLVKKAPKVPETRRLFSIHAGIFSLNKFIETLNKYEFQPSTFENYITPYAHHIIDSVIDDIFHLRSVSLPFDLDSILYESIDSVREILLREDYFLFNRFSIYRALWSILFNRKKWIEEEEEFLATTDSDDHVGNLLALVHLAFLQKRDTEAVNYLSRLDSSYVSYSFWWIHLLSNNHDWKRARHWIEYSAKHIDKYMDSLPSYDARRHFTRTYLSEIYEYFQINDQALYVEMMKKLLPYSFVELDHYLLGIGEYKSWVELQILLGYTADDCDRQTLKLIEENDRQAVLPFYHHAVMNSLEQKNRQSYKRAVRYLKKLRTNYRRLNKLDSWDIYIEKLSVSHKRLRAFQEELTRAKLIIQE